LLWESFAWENDKLGLKANAVVLTRKLDAFRDKAPHLVAHPAIQFHVGDVRSFEFPKGEFSHIIHAATETGNQPATIDPILRFTSNIDGTRRVLGFARDSGARKFLFTSSGAVYGKQPSDMAHISENYVGAPETTDPNTDYGQSKRASEFLCAAYAKKYGLHILIARCFAFVGPGLPLDSNFAVGNFIRDAMNGDPIQIDGDGTPFRSYLYAADLAIWLWTILFRGRSCRPYNIGSDEAISIADLAQRVREVIAPQARVAVAGKPVEGQPAERYVPSIERCESELGLHVRIPLTEAIRRTAGWYSPVFQKEQRGT